MNGNEPTNGTGLAPDQVRKLLGQHRQQRHFSCFQSAPEMWLKLNKVIGWTEYPEQSFPQNDLKGYEPYPVDGVKTYNGSAIHFRKETFNPPYDELFKRLRSELAEGRFIVVSLRPPWGGWHGYVVTHAVGDDFIVFSKHGLNEADTEEDTLSNRLKTNEKVDCLFMKVSRQP